jgi:hypothetical protein
MDIPVPYLPFDEKQEDYYQAVPPIWQAHRLFMTSAGHIGLGPRAMQFGDLVTIIKCCPYAAILRRYQTWYLFVRMAYVFDVRYADIRSVWDVEDFEQLEQFELR